MKRIRQSIKRRHHSRFTCYAMYHSVTSLDFYSCCYVFNFFGWILQHVLTNYDPSTRMYAIAYLYFLLVGPPSWVIYILNLVCACNLKQFQIFCKVKIFICLYNKVFLSIFIPIFLFSILKKFMLFHDIHIFGKFAFACVFFLCRAFLTLLSITIYIEWVVVSFYNFK